MASEALADSASFRDPSGYVYHIDGRIFRTVNEPALRDLKAVRATGVYQDLVTEGKVIAGEIVDRIPEPLRRQARLVLEHPLLPFISYAYERSFAALKQAALLHLAIHLTALDRGVTLSDASAYNIPFIGATPIFIDSLSFRPYREDEFWTGHRQFCEQSLNPLLLRAMCGARPNEWYRGALEGIPTADFTRLLPLRRKLSWNVLSNLVLPATLERSARRGDIGPRSGDLATAKFPRSSSSRLLHRLRAWIARLHIDGKTPTTWRNYSVENSYRPEETRAKQDFVGTFVRAEKPAMAWDLGCNTGDYSEVALDAGAAYAVGWDYDHGALEWPSLELVGAISRSRRCSSTRRTRRQTRAGPWKSATA